MTVRDRVGRWKAVQSNPSYWQSALSLEEGLAMRWHAPLAPRSSQVFCVSALCGLRAVADRDEILGRLFEPFLGPDCAVGPWTLKPEYSRREHLGETGAGTPTCVDVFCESPKAVVCVEGKLVFDARDGFGRCGQARTGHCAGYYGLGSDLKTGSSASCRLEVAERRRAPRRYWDLARPYFEESTFRVQASGEVCPFAGSNFQLMRNFLFAAAAAGPGRVFAVVCMVPAAERTVVDRQMADFRNGLLRTEYRSAAGIRTYDELADLLRASHHAQSNRLGHFLYERLTTLL